MGSKKPPKLKLKQTSVNTGFANASYNPKTGKAGYTLNPELAKFRDIFYGAANQMVPTEEDLQFSQDVQGRGTTLFGRGQEFLDQATALDTGALAQDYYDRTQALQAPMRAQEEARLADTLFKTGRTGAAVGYGSGYINPEQFTLLSARNQADNQLALDAQQYGRNLRDSDIRSALGLSTSGLGLFESGNQLGMLPYQNAATLFGVGTGIEGLGANTLNQVGQFSQLQMAADQALQANKASRQGGGFMSGLGGGLLSAGLSAFGNSFGGPIGAAAGRAVGGLFSGGGGEGGSSFPIDFGSIATPGFNSGRWW